MDSSMNTLKRAAERLQNSAEEIEAPDGLSVCVGIDAWNEFFEALDSELDRMARSEPRAVLMAAMRDAVSDMKAGAFLADCGTDIAFRSVNYAAIADRYASQVAQDGPVNRQLLAETVALLERHQKWLNKLPVPTAGATYQMMNLVGKAIDTLAGMAEENHQAEPVAGQCKFSCESKWLPCSVEHHYHVLSCPDEWPGYETRLLYTAPQPSMPPGWKLVPVEPTSKMIVAGAEADPQFFTHAQFVYRAMLAAAPEQEGGAA